MEQSHGPAASWRQPHQETFASVEDQGEGLYRHSLLEIDPFDPVTNFPGKLYPALVRIRPVKTPIMTLGKKEDGDHSPKISKELSGLQE